MLSKFKIKNSAAFTEILKDVSEGTATMPLSVSLIVTKQDRENYGLSITARGDKELCLLQPEEKKEILKALYKGIRASLDINQAKPV